MKEITVIFHVIFVSRPSNKDSAVMPKVIFLLDLNGGIF